ncbi:hypothetical protein BsWGS_25345 [Bradybaena similaris]
MQTLYLLMMSTILVASASDVAVTIQGEVNHLNLTNRNLNMLHRCLCNTSHTSCTFNVLKEKITSTGSAVAQANSSTEYLNVYMCTLHTVSINCIRRTQNQQQESTILQKAKSFSLHDNHTCDISCVDVFWDDTVRNISIKTDKMSGRSCASNSPDVISTTHIIIIAVSCVVAVVVISVIVAVCVRAKRQKQLQNTAPSNADSETYKHPEEEQLSGQEPPHLYCEVEKDEPEPQEIPENTQPRNKNAYSKLRLKPEKAVNTYNILLPNEPEILPAKPPRLYT